MEKFSPYLGAKSTGIPERVNNLKLSLQVATGFPAGAGMPTSSEMNIKKL